MSLKLINSEHLGFELFADPGGFLLYGTWVGIELAAVLMAFISAWIGANKASKLVYGGSAASVNRKARKQLFWAALLLVPAAAVPVAVWFLSQSYDSLFWKDRLLLQMPLVVLPVLAIWIIAVPKLLRLRKETSDRTDDPSRPEVRALASQPGLIVPFHAAALGAGAALFFGFVPPVPAKWLDVFLPVLLFLIVSAVFWVLHARRRKRLSNPQADVTFRPWLRVLRNWGVFLAACAAAAALIFIGMESSRMPARFDMMSGEVTFGKGVPLAHNHGHGTKGEAHEDDDVPEVSVTSLTGPKTEKPDRQFTLIAQKATVRLSSGKMVEVWTYNGELPGPELRIKEGQLVEVTLINKDIDQGATIHWHGLDVPNAEDGVAGATQDAVMPGGRHTYRFRADQAGTFWYHSHQASREAVHKGLFGSLIVEPKDTKSPAETDISVMTHVWDGAGLAIGTTDTVVRKAIAPGTPVRLRLTNTDDWVQQKYVLVGAKFKVAAIDGTDLHEPGDLRNTHLELTTGGRYDITFIMPNTSVFLSVGGNKSHGIFMSPDGNGGIPDIPATTSFDPMHYGASATTPFTADSEFDREFKLVLDNKFGFYNGHFSNLFTMNGAVFPNTPMFMVREGERVKTTIINRSMVEHPMHLHGHHMLVLSHNGQKATGSPWWTDTLGVLPGDTYEVAFVADNPGIWMDHCHNLEHAEDGMTMHLMYEGVTTPFVIGSATNNRPE